jgi:hypothetical protein
MFGFIYVKGYPMIGKTGKVVEYHLVFTKDMGYIISMTGEKTSQKK